MKDDFDDVRAGSGPGLEDLAEEYHLPALEQLFEQRAQMVPLMSLEGLTVEAINLRDRNCTIIFNFLEEDGDDGFELSLVDDDSHEALVSVYYGMSDPLSGVFDITGGHISGLPEGDNSEVDPWSVMVALIEDDEPDEGFPVPIKPSPYLH